MTSSQARGVKSIGSSATVIGIGHNPASSAKVDRFIHLAEFTRRLESPPLVLRDNWSNLARDLHESRFESFERLLASYEIFHSAAAKTRDFMNRLVPLGNLFWAPVFLTVGALTLGRVRPRFGYGDLAPHPERHAHRNQRRLCRRSLRIHATIPTSDFTR